MSGALHKNLVARVVRANQTAQTTDFWSTLVRHLVAESGDITGGVYEDSMPNVEAYALPRSEFERAYLQAAGRALALTIGGRILPDAFQLDERHMTLVIWEVSVTNSMRKSIEKWDELLCELDCIDEWTVAVISVDARGLCTFERQTDSAPELITWHADATCPIDWNVGVRYTDRSRQGGLDAAFARAMAGIRLRHRSGTSEAAE